MRTARRRTQEEIEAEERKFALSLLMLEVDETRQCLKEKWGVWAKKKYQNDEDAGQELLAMTAVTDYAISALRKTILQVSIEIDFFEDFD